jgi:hypothetical protein
MIVRKKRQTYRLVGGSKTIGKVTKITHGAKQVGKALGYGAIATVAAAPVVAAATAYGAVAVPLAVAGVVGKSLVHGARAAGTGTVGLYQKAKKYSARSTLENQMGTRYTQNEILEKSRKHQSTIKTLQNNKKSLTNITNKKAIQKIDKQLKKAQKNQSSFETKQLAGISSKSKTGAAATATDAESFNNKIKRLYNSRKTEYNSAKAEKFNKSKAKTNLLTKKNSRKTNLNQRQINFDTLQKQLTNKETDINAAKEAATQALTEWKTATDNKRKTKLEKELYKQTSKLKGLETESKNLRAQTIKAEKDKVDAQGRVTNSELQLQKQQAKLAKQQVTGSENSLARRSERLNLTKKKLGVIGKELKVNLTKTGSNLRHGRVLSLLGNITTRPLSSTGSAIKSAISSAASSIYYAPKNLYQRISKSTAGNSLSLSLGKTANIVERAKGYKSELAKFTQQKNAQDTILQKSDATIEAKNAAKLALKTINEKITNLSGRVNLFTTSLEQGSTKTAEAKLKNDLTALTSDPKLKAYFKKNPNAKVVDNVKKYYNNENINLEKINEDINKLKEQYNEGKIDKKIILEQYKALAGLRKLAKKSRTNHR